MVASMKPTNKIFYPTNLKLGKKLPQASEATQFLQYHDKLAALMPAVRRHIKLQKQCQEILPMLFEYCEVLNLSEAQLVLAAPNASLASKLKQHLPNLQSQLVQRGWEINAIKIKVQVKKTIEKPAPIKQAHLSNNAKLAFENLKLSLPTSNQNQGLQEALETLLKNRAKRESQS